MQPLSVMDKGSTPVSGNKHDYMSQAPYFWYDSTKPNGLPYINRDGQRNPEITRITDHDNLAQLGNAVQALSLAWYLTRDSKYAEKAAGLLQHWFLDSATKMNPNLDYGQAIPGLNNGRGIGIIETIPLISIADAARLLEGSPAWPASKSQALQTWYAQYLHWMLTSKNGMDEHAATNNHGTWYLAQAVDIALFSGDTAKAHSLAEEGKAKIEHQIAADGKMSRELARTNALHYSTYNLRAFFILARLASHTGVDLWNYNSTQHAGIRTAFDWLVPYAVGSRKWEYQEISGYNKDDFYPLLLQAYGVYHAPAYLTSAKLIHPGRGNALTELPWGL
ncbi:MAG TPA: alginate lyase family protein [Puia sp.]|nr:alginate lyase family protein [Puia sp.]